MSVSRTPGLRGEAQKMGTLQHGLHAAVVSVFIHVCRLDNAIPRRAVPTASSCTFCSYLVS